MEKDRHKRNSNLYYLQYVKEIINVQMASLENFERLMLTLSIAIFSFSIMALKLLDLDTSSPYMPIMYLSYVCFTITIGTAIASLLLIFSSMTNLLKKYKQFNDDMEEVIITLIKTTNSIKRLNAVTAISFVAALFALGLFVFVISTTADAVAATSMTHVFS